MKRVLQIGGLSILASGLGVAGLYYEYQKPSIPFSRDAQGNVYVPANTKPEELFVNPAAGDFRLRAENPAAGKGVPLAIVRTDFNGAPRDPQHPSIGAFEYNGPPPSGGTSASKFFSAPFTYFVLFSTLASNVVSLYLSSRILKQTATQQLALMAALKMALGRTKRDRRNLKAIGPALPAQEVLEKIKEAQRR